MPNHKSAKKRVRQTAKRNLINRAGRSNLRTTIKKLRKAFTTGNVEESNTLLSPTVSTIDKAVNKGLIHKNTAARYKSRLTSHVNSISK
jgi:small subunit ribosomal protein S20